MENPDNGNVPPLNGSPGMSVPDDDQPTIIRRLLLAAPSATPDASAVAHDPEVPVPGTRRAPLATWSLWLSLVAWLFAVAAILMVATTTPFVPGARLLALEWGSIALAALATGAGVLGLRKATRHDPRPVLPRASAGLVLAIGVLVATLILGG
jgi:hypothetical protein